MHIWHGAVAIILVCIGIAIIAGVARLLYTPDFFLFNFGFGNSQNELSFSCPGMTFTVSVSEDSAHVSLADGREFDAVRNPPASEVPEGQEWARYASESLVFWYATDRALLEENGVVLYGECVAQ